MSAPEIRYTRSDDVMLAWGVVGDGPYDLVYAPGWVPSVFDVGWDGPAGPGLEKLAQGCRLILFDKRGTGLSDRVEGFPDLETRMDDLRAVMDAAGSQRAAVMGISEGGPLAAVFAATYPERVAAVIFCGTGAAYARADDYPWAATREESLAQIDALRGEGWTDDRLRKALRVMFGRDDVPPDLWAWWCRWVRTGASPGAALALHRMNVDIDVRRVLPLITAPSLVVHNEGDTSFHPDEGRYIASKIPGARFQLVPGNHHLWFMDPDPVVDAVHAFLGSIWLSGEWDAGDTERVLATVVFTDIVDSTAHAVSLGDRRWRDVLSEHHALVRRQLARFRGVEVDTAGDGFFARFDGPARAIRCARAITDGARPLGIEVRAGVHAGECELLDGKVGGIAVHIGARVASQAQPGEVLVSQTVKDLVAGSGIEFAERGAAQLKGVPGEWRLYALSALRG